MTFDSALNTIPSQASPRIKQPKLILSDQAGDRPGSLFSFSPNRETLGGTAYLIVEEANILVDCPAWDEATQAFLQAQGGVDWLVLTHRSAIARVREIQQTFHCAIVIQEQEAYLLPGLTPTTFERELALTPTAQAIWTPGHSPGSACLYTQRFGGVLCSGRHLLPNPQGQIMPLKTAKTFHWRRQLRSVEQLKARFTPETLNAICPGANSGFLRGKGCIKEAYQTLLQIETAEAAR